MMRKITGFALWTVILLMMITACSGKDAPAAPEPGAGTPAGSASGSKVGPPSGKKFVVGILPAEAAIPIILAQEKGFLKEEGAAIEIKAFSSPGDRNIAVQAKGLDAVIADVMTAAAFRHNGIAMTVTSDISEDFKILSSPGSGITAMNKLNGKKVSLVRNFILEYIMDQYAQKDGFSYSIVEIPSFAGRAEALLSDQIDGVVFTEPQAGMLVKQGAHLLGSSREAGIKGGTLLFTDEMIKRYPGDIAAFYKAYNRAIDYMNDTDPSQYVDILIRYQFPEQIGAYLTGLTGGFEHAGTIERERFDDIVRWTQTKGLINKTYSYDDLTDFSFVAP